MTSPGTSARTVALVTLGCTRNEVDSEELAGRLAREGWILVDDAGEADVAVVNTCGFVEQAKKDSIDALLEAADLKEQGRTQAVVAVGCLAERYGQTLADELPEADAVLGFDSYADMSGQLRRILAGERPASHVPTDRRALLPLTPVDRGPLLPGWRSPDMGVGAAGPPGLPALGPPEDCQRLRPALRVLRDPVVPRVVRVAPPDRDHRRGAVAGRVRRA